MSKLQDLINKLCPNGVEYKYITDGNKTSTIIDTIKSGKRFEGSDFTNGYYN